MVRAVSRQDSEVTPAMPDAVADRLAEVLEHRGLDLIRSAMQAARELVGMELAFVSEMEPDTQTYRYVAGDGDSFGLPEGHVDAAEHGYCARMVAELIPNIVPDVRADPRTSDVVATVAADVGAYIGVPLRLADGRLFGTFCCLSHDAQPELGQRDRTIMRLLARLVSDELDREASAAQTRRLRLEAEASQALVAALQAREGYTAEHSRSVVELSLAVGRELGLDDQELVALGQVALLHDVGKIGVPDAVLLKPGPLEAGELEAMREHPAIGERILAAVEGLRHLAPAVRAEHERWDGSGYPDGLAGEAIPLASRICLACDAYDAMTTDRPYRRALATEDAIAELRRGAGAQFDPRVVEALLAVV
jgi:HD-GYP domain-containing protein (c-di-GMP phosphodiesterase class II)